MKHCQISSPQKLSLITMQKISIFFLLFVQPFLAFAAAPLAYQVDLIVFAYTNAVLPARDLPVFLNPGKDVLLLSKTPKKENYSLLPSEASHLLPVYYSLRNKAPYQILAHYSWKQPVKGRQQLLLKPARIQGLEMEGLIRISSNQYYSLDSQFHIASEDQQQHIIFSKKERLKPNKLYYLDHKNAGMFIRIQPI